MHRAGRVLPNGIENGHIITYVDYSRSVPAAERERLGGNGQRYFKANFDHDMLTDQLIAHIRSASVSYKEKK